MTGTDLCVNKPHKSRSYLNHLVSLSPRTPRRHTQAVQRSSSHS